MIKVNNFLRKSLYAIVFMVLILYLTIISVTALHHQTLSFLFSFIGIPIILWLLKSINFNIFNKKKEIIIFIIILSIIIKSFVSFLYYPKLVADYGVFYNFASSYSQSYYNSYNNLYLSLFNHVFGYPFILSFLFYIFGSRIIIAVLFNIFLSVVSVVLLYLICEKCFDKKVAFLSSLFWIICPSQSLWNSFVLSEPLYTCILLLIIYILVKNSKIISKKKCIIVGMIVGIILAIFNMIRPIGIIVLFSIFLWIFFVKEKGNYISKILLFIMIFISYSLFKTGINYIIQDRNYIKLGGFSWYNINVGLNYDSNGTWNQGDWDRVLNNVNKFNKEGKDNPALYAQQEEKKLVYNKIKNIKKPVSFFYNKLYIFIGSDSGVVDHLSDSSAFNDIRQKQSLSFICNVFYYFLLTSSVIGAIIYYKREKANNNKDIILIILYGLGLACGHFIAEVQPRYHYSFLIVLIVISSYCFVSLNNIINVKKRGEK